MRPCACSHCFHPACLLRSFVSDLMANGGDGDGIEVEINNTETCPLCRILPRTGPTWSRIDGDEFVEELSLVRDCMLSCTLQSLVSGEDPGEIYFMLRATMERIQKTFRPCRPCLPEHRRGYGTPKFCRSCSPSCTICAASSWLRKYEKEWSERGFITEGGFIKRLVETSQEGSETIHRCHDPMWRAKDGPEEGAIFCDFCFWMRLSVIGLVHTGSLRSRFERLEASSFLRMRPGILGDEGSGCFEEVSDGQDGSRGDD